ncbi:hypothetical protein [Amycolatopsis orientalis]|uniref:hypothetical protein n=1 Tax=Amycolatopsis orientalis TaxID=31958 RepID=UPI0012683883|nr:hypothetical protein [Amycolatopsis orientalis]
MGTREVIEMHDSAVLRIAGRRPVERQTGFVELVCADPGWLRTEFDAIVAANFGDRSAPRRVPPRRPPDHHSEARGDRAAGATRRPGPRRGAHPGIRATAARAPARERSPPYSFLD